MATPTQTAAMTLIDMRETRSTNPLREDIDSKTIEQLKVIELNYWNLWEHACRFDDERIRDNCMERIGALRDLYGKIEIDYLRR